MFYNFNVTLVSILYQVPMFYYVICNVSPSTVDDDVF
jgi:hypothetical protein